MLLMLLDKTENVPFENAVVNADLWLSQMQKISKVYELSPEQDSYTFSFMALGTWRRRKKGNKGAKRKG